MIEAAEERPVPKQINKINSKSREADAAELDKLSASGRELWRKKKKGAVISRRSIHVE